MKQAIPAFMKIPILHIDHTERPVGYVTTCRVIEKGDPVLKEAHPDHDPDARIGDTYFKAEIPEDGDTGDVWGKIEKGWYNKISIYGVRTLASPECRLRPGERVSPCITKGIRLWSFSLVGENAINPNSYIKIAKSFSEDLCPEFTEKTNELIKAAFPGIDMAPDADQQAPGTDSSTDGGATVQKADVVMKSDFDPVIQDVTVMKGDIAEVKTGIAGILEFIKKGDAPKTETAKTPDVKDTDYITKATLEPVLDLIIKAKVELAVTEIKKAYDAQFAEMKEQMKAFGSETIRKGGNTVILDLDGSPLGKMDNSFISNFDALEG